MARVGVRCECADKGCRYHPGQSECRKGNFGAVRPLYRVDMQDVSGTMLCDRCADDAIESGLFRDEDDEDDDADGCEECSDKGLTHADYPHDPGYLDSCDACQDHCHCSDATGQRIEGQAACVFSECSDDESEASE